MMLGLDTTTEFLHLALVLKERAWTRRVAVGQGKSHSTGLIPCLNELLAEAERGPEALTGVVVCVGPGGFTSLRVGVATAEGLALTGLSTWGFSAFALRASALRYGGLQERVWILLDGQRDECFAQPWAATACEPAVRHPLREIRQWVRDDPWWAPVGFRDRAQAAMGRPPVCLEDEGAAALAGLVALCRTLPLREPEPVLVPFYLRETDAEMNFPQASGHLQEALRRGHAR